MARGHSCSCCHFSDLTKKKCAEDPISICFSKLQSQEVLLARIPCQAFLAHVAYTGPCAKEPSRGGESMVAETWYFPPGLVPFIRLIIYFQ